MNGSATAENDEYERVTAMLIFQCMTEARLVSFALLVSPLERLLISLIVIHSSEPYFRLTCGQPRSCIHLLQTTAIVVLIAVPLTRTAPLLIGSHRVSTTS